jgi:hypothetical protein
MTRCLIRPDMRPGLVEPQAEVEAAKAELERIRRSD